MPQREPEPDYAKWEILALTRKADRKKLEQFLLPKGGLSLAAESILDYVLRPAKNKKLPFCQTAIIEHEYFDEDFVGGISSFYSKGYWDVERICKRVHFFTRNIITSDLTSLDKFADQYLGFCVIRPLGMKTLGRTVLKPRRDDAELDFPTCCGRFPANLAGTQLFVDSAVYMEQDGRVQTCSSIAIWISTSTIAHCFNFSQYTTMEIMEKATRTFVGPRAGPTLGLSYEQMMSALRDMGYDPILFWEADKPEAIYRIYSYVESGIPPILLLQLPNGAGHAIAAVGHAHSRPLKPQWQARVSWLGKEIIRYFRSSEWVPYFYVHDDQRGIFRKLSFLDPDSNQLRQRILNAHAHTRFPVELNVDLRTWHCPVSIEVNLPKAEIPREEIANLWGIIAPLPRGVTLSHSEAESKSAWIIRLCFDRLGLTIPDDLVLRSYLVRSNDYKMRLGQSSDIHPFRQMLYRGKPLPKWLWLTEMSTINMVNAASVNDLRIRGELVLDGTGNPWPTDFLAFHWISDDNDGLIATMTRSDQDVTDAIAIGWRLPGEQPYRPLTR